jgi:tol-pal system protein YbgF
VKNLRNTLFLLSPLLVWGGGCATQTDLQAEQRARESLRAQIAADSRTAFDEVRHDIQKVRGEVEEMRNRLDRVAKEKFGAGPQIKVLEDRVTVLERQLKARSEDLSSPGNGVARPMEGSTGQFSTEPSGMPSGASTTPPAGSPSPATDATPPAGRETAGLPKETADAPDEYRTGLRAFQDQQFDKAIQQFRLFQRKYPTSDMADDAQYWIGESYFNQKDYNRAILEFNDVLKYRKGDRVPGALLRQAQAFIEIGDKTDARLILQKLLNDHPSSEQAREAKERLQTIR